LVVLRLKKCWLFFSARYRQSFCSLPSWGNFSPVQGASQSLCGGMRHVLTLFPRLLMSTSRVTPLLIPVFFESCVPCPKVTPGHHRHSNFHRSFTCHVYTVVVRFFSLDSLENGKKAPPPRGVTIRPVQCDDNGQRFRE